MQNPGEGAPKQDGELAKVLPMRPESKVDRMETLEKFLDRVGETFNGPKDSMNDVMVHLEMSIRREGDDEIKVELERRAELIREMLDGTDPLTVSISEFQDKLR